MKYSLQIEFEVFEEKLDAKLGGAFRDAYEIAKAKEGTPERGLVPFMHLFPKEIRNSDAIIMSIEAFATPNIPSIMSPQDYSKVSQKRVEVKIIIPNIAYQEMIKPTFKVKTEKLQFGLTLHNTNKLKETVQEARAALRRIYTGVPTNLVVIRELRDTVGRSFDGIIVTKEAEEDMRYPLHEILLKCNVDASKLVRLDTGATV